MGGRQGVQAVPQPGGAAVEARGPRGGRRQQRCARLQAGGDDDRGCRGHRVRRCCALRVPERDGRARVIRGQKVKSPSRGKTRASGKAAAQANAVKEARTRRAGHWREARRALSLDERRRRRENRARANGAALPDRATRRLDGERERLGRAQARVRRSGLDWQCLRGCDLPEAELHVRKSRATARARPAWSGASRLSLTDWITITRNRPSGASTSRSAARSASTSSSYTSRCSALLASRPCRFRKLCCAPSWLSSSRRNGKAIQIRRTLSRRLQCARPTDEPRRGTRPKRWAQRRRRRRRRRRR